ncbi:unnamed protein product [Brassica oleracea var. botrytis]|uniref:RING-type E3 ubiquitin transferase n=1 Tax=Brassica carinata TaxID=52824 RepID=A0A8X7ULZ8_BRACI|nr:hypothetical protein Bca52824_054599 [Brassica carinata]
MEVGRSFEEARSAEETLMSVPKMENAKCRATMEASEKGQMMAELEGNKQKYKKEGNHTRKAVNAFVHNDVMYKRYYIKEIEAVTNRFTSNIKVGQGGYGPVTHTLSHPCCH